MADAALHRRRFLLAAAAVGAAPAVARAAEPGLLLHGGPIYTGRDDAPRAEAVLTRGKRIVFVGALSEARALAAGAREIDLKGAAAYPGFVDAHAHMTEIGLQSFVLDLTGTTSVADLQARLRAYAQANPGPGSIFGRGWIETHWPDKRFPNRDDLDAVVPDRPVLLGRSDGHAGVANSQGLVLAGIAPATPDPDGGQILRDGSGRPNGMLVDHAWGEAEHRLPDAPTAVRREALRRADRLYLSRGWTGLHHMSVSAEDLGLLRGLAGDRGIALRVDNFMAPEAADDVLARGPSADPTGLVRVRGVKMYMDGALGSRGAALLAPYADSPGSTGLLLSDPARMAPILDRAWKSGAQVATHAIGDRGNRLVLDGYQAAFARAGGEGRRARWRVEHAQILAPADIPRFARLGVIASMQPSHAIGDLYFAGQRLGPDRLKGAYAWKSLLDSGAVVCAGSDAPVEKGDPLIEFYAATWRHALDGFAGPDWGLDQAVSRQRALAMLTRAPAYAVGREHELGALEAGKLADLTVFSTDIMTAPPADILKARAVLTVVDGAVAYEA